MDLVATSAFHDIRDRETIDAASGEDFDSARDMANVGSDIFGAVVCACFLAGGFLLLATLFFSALLDLWEAARLTAGL